MEIKSDSLFLIHYDNIQKANIIYTQQVKTINSLLLIDSLRRRETLHLTLAFQTSQKTNSINQTIINNNTHAIDNYQSIIKTMDTRQKILYGIIVSLATYCFIK